MFNKNRFSLWNEIISRDSPPLQLHPKTVDPLLRSRVQRNKHTILVKFSNFFCFRQNCSETEDRTGSPCPPSKYRSASGECNNVRHRPWGRRGDVLLRLLPPNYADG